MFGSRAGFSETADRTAPFPVVSGRYFVNSHAVSLKHMLGFMLCVYTDHTLPSDAITTVDACDMRLNT